MPTVLLTIDAANAATPVLTGVSQTFTDLDAAIGRTNQNLGAVNTRLDTFAKRMAAIDTSATTGGKAFDRLAGAADIAIGRIIGKFDALTASIGRSTDALVVQMGVYKDLAAAAAAIRPPAVPRIPTAVAAGTGRSAAATAAQNLINVRAASNLAGRGLGVGEGMLAPLGAGAFSGPGLAAIGTGLAAFYAGKQAADLQSNVIQTLVQAGVPNNQVLAQAAPFQQSLLNYTAGGKSQYSAQDLAAQLEPLIATNSTRAVLGALPAIVGLSEQNRAPDLTKVVLAVNTIAATYGSGRSTTAAQLSSYADMLSKAEQRTSAPPGTLTNALPQLLTGMKGGTGISFQDALALYTNASIQNPRTRIDVQGLNQLFAELSGKPQKGAIAEANKLGIVIGPGSTELYGGIIGQLKAIQAKNPTNVDIANLFPLQNARRTYQQVIAGSGLPGAERLSREVVNSAGSAAGAGTGVSLGTAQQVNETMVRFKADMASLGTVLNDTVTPALLKFANQGLKGAETFGSSLGTLSTWIDANLGKGTVADFWSGFGQSFKTSLTPITQLAPFTQVSEVFNGVKNLTGAVNNAINGTPATVKSLAAGIGNVPPTPTSSPSISSSTGLALNSYNLQGPALTGNPRLYSNTKGAVPFDPFSLQGSTPPPPLPPTPAEPLRNSILDLMRLPPAPALTPIGSRMLNAEQARGSGVTAPGPSGERPANQTAINAALAAQKLQATSPTNVRDALTTLKNDITEKLSRSVIDAALASYEKAVRANPNLDAAQKRNDIVNATALVTRYEQGSTAVSRIPKQIPTAQPGPGALLAGNENTAVRFAGQQDPLVLENRQLRRELDQANNRIAALLTEIRDNVKAAFSGSPARPNPQKSYGARGTKH